MGQVIYIKPTDSIFQRFENYEIHPCCMVGKDNSGNVIYEQCNSDDSNIAIWCVYGHLLPQGNIGGLECISDHDELEEAEEFERSLPILKL